MRLRRRTNFTSNDAHLYNSNKSSMTHSSHVGINTNSSFSQNYNNSLNRQQSIFMVSLYQQQQNKKSMSRIIKTTHHYKL